MKINKELPSFTGARALAHLSRGRSAKAVLACARARARELEPVLRATGTPIARVRAGIQKLGETPSTRRMCTEEYSEKNNKK